MDTYCFHTLRRPVTKVCFFLLFPIILEDFFSSISILFTDRAISPKNVLCPLLILFIFCHDIRSRRHLQRINQSYPENILFKKWKRNYADLNILIQALCLLHTNNNKTYHYINRMKAGVMKKIIMMMMKWLYQDSHYLH